MKTLKFKDYLAPAVLDGSKTTTWRLFDDKNLQAGDELLLVNAATGKEFAKAHILYVREKKLGEVGDADFDEGHERYDTEEDILEEYRKYYGDAVNLSSSLKIIKYELID